MRAGLVLPLLLVAGCLGASAPDATPPLSEPRFTGEHIVEPLPFLAEDGVTLDLWVFRPDTEEAVPVIVNFSPYWSNLAPPASTGGDPYSLHLIERYVPRGYAVALVSVRGTGLSEGCFSIGGSQEIDDADAIVTFLAEQDWSSGSVAAVAKSYDGTVAQALLARGNPHLKTIVPVSPISEWYKYNLFAGVPYTTGGLAFNTYYVDLVSLRQNPDPRNETYEMTPTRVCDESADVQAAQYEGAFTGDYSAYWEERNYTAQLPATISTSVFYVHGLQDWNVKPDHMVPWIDELRARNVTLKMWLGQWGHDYPHRDDWNDTTLAWFDSELKGIDTGIRAAPRVQVQDDTGIWRDEDEWPPARAVPTAFYPSGDGTLAAAPGSGSSAYADGPTGALARVPVAGSVAFESDPLPRAMRLAGAPFLTASVSATGPRATIAATLLLDGRVIDQGFLDLAHRDSLATPSPMTPGASYDVLVSFYPQDVLLPAGSVLTLVLASAAPQGAPVEVTPFSAGGVVTIAHGAGTALTLPLLAAEDVRIEERQPLDVGCWSC